MLMKAVEARKKAEVAHMHINKCRNTHAVHSIHSFFSTHLPSQKIVALEHFSFECTVALCYILIVLSKFK